MKPLPLLFLQIGLGCTSAKKEVISLDSLTQADTVVTPAVPTSSVTSQEKVYWPNGSMYERDVTAALNPLEINYNDTA